MQLFGWDTPLFQLGGPFAELANVSFMFVLLQFVRMGVRRLVTGNNNGNDDDKAKKIASNAWYALYYSIALCMGMYLFYITGWMDGATICSHEPQHVSLTTYPLLHIYHCMQVAFYLNYVYAMLTGIDAPRKDGIAYMIHHVLTILLILFSRNWGFMRIQLGVFVIHDAADPILHVAKHIKYTAPQCPSWVTDSLLGVFAVVFYVTRIFVYPAYLVDPCRVNLPSVGPNEADVYTAALYCLYALFVLHVYWGLHILRIVWDKFSLSSSSSSAPVLVAQHPSIERIRQEEERGSAQRRYPRRTNR